MIDPSVLDNIDADTNHFDQLYPSVNASNSRQYYSSNDYNEKFCVSSVNDLNVIHLNIRSLSKNGDELCAFLSLIKTNFDVVCLSETWVSELGIVDDIFPNYNSYHSIRKNSIGGGVAIYLKKNINCKIIPEITLNESYIESVFIQSCRLNKKFLIGCCYRPPSGDLEQFQEFIDNKLNNLSSESNDLIVCGDFNLDMLKITENRSCENFYHSMSSIALTPVITKPSRVTDTSWTIIDNFFISNLNNFTSGLFLVNITDHYPIFLNYKNFFTPSSLAPVKVTYRLISDDTLMNLYNNMATDDLAGLMGPDINQSIEVLHNKILEKLNETCPIITKTISPKDKIKPWITPEIKSMIKHKQFLYRLKLLNSVTPQVFNRFKNYVTLRIRRAKLDYNRNLFEGLKNNIKKTWQTINNILGKGQKDSTIESLMWGGNKYSEKIDIANILNDHFSTIAQKIDDSIPVVPPGHPEPLDFMRHLGVPNSFFFSPITPNDVNRIILSFENKNSHFSTYSIKVLKSLSNLISPVLCHLINKSFSVGKFPDFCKLAQVIPLFKAGNPLEVGNYRPISILPIFSKVFEKVVHKQLTDYLNKFKLINKNQFGFRRNRSTSSAIIDMLQFVYEGLDRGDDVLSFFLDFSKAFDCVNPQILLQKLMVYGVRGVALAWFQSYLTDRHQCVKFDGVSSGTVPMTLGVPQGSILGPLLFLIYINDFPDCSTFFKFTLFADDSTLTCRFPRSNNSIICNTIESELLNVQKWLTCNRLKLNSEKSHFIQFSYRSQTVLRPIKLCNNFIYEKEKTKFLGMVLDRHLRFDDHVAHILAKTSRSIGIIYKLNGQLPTNILKLLYHTLVLPYFNYAIETWFAAPAYVSDRALVAQKRAIRAVYKLPFNDHTNQYFKNEKILKIGELYNLNLCCLLFKILSSEDPPPLADGLVIHSSLHNYGTRHSQNLVIPRFSRSKSQTCFMYRSISEWNRIPDVIKQKKYLHSFKFNLKKHYLSFY